MTVVREGGEVNIHPYKKKASQVFAKNSIVADDANGFLVPATSASTVAVIRGIIERDVLATDEDYADASDVGLEVPRKDDDEFVMLVGAGVPAQSMVGQLYDLTDAVSVNLTAQLIGVVRVERIISSTKVLVSFA